MVELCVSCATTFINQVWKIVVIIFRGWNRKYIADAQVVHSKEISDNNVKKERKKEKERNIENGGSDIRELIALTSNERSINRMSYCRQ